MAHIHGVYDTDKHFVIDPVTRAITNNSAKNVLMQGDHNSEIYTFEIPKVVEGHDMSQCNRVEIHYNNIAADKANQSKDYHVVEDMYIEEGETETLHFSWQVHGNATKYAGALSFRIRFGCVDENGMWTYKWHTDIFKGITISDGFDNTAAVIEDYADAIAAWEAELDAFENRIEILEKSGGLTDEQAANAIEEYFEKNPITPEEIGAAPENTHYIKTYTRLDQLGLANGATLSEVANALPAGATLRMYVLTTAYPNLSPTTTNGWLEAHRPSVNHVHFDYTATSRKKYLAVALDVGAENETVSEWLRKVTENDLGTITPAKIGAATPEYVDNAISNALGAIEKGDPGVYVGDRANIPEGTKVWINPDGEASAPDSSQNVELDTTLTVEGKAADAKVVGDALASKQPKGDYLTEADEAEIAAKVPIVKVAEQPEFVNDISECTDTSKVYLLPNGHLAAYMTKEVTTEGSTVPNFTNIYNKENGAYIKDGYRYSHSGGAFSAEAATCAVVVPVPASIGSWKANQQYTLRVQGATINGGTTRYKKIYNGTSSDSFSIGGAEATPTTQADGTVVLVHTPLVNDNIATFSWIVFHVDDGVDENNLIVTFNEEITYTTTEGGTEIVTEWVDTGNEYNQPPDYSDRVVAVEKKTAQLTQDVDALENRVNNIGGGSSSGSGGMDAFAYAAYPPSPQLLGDGSEEADFNTADVATAEVYAYMDALWSRYRTYMVKQNLGKDSSGQYDYYRYVFSKAYWRAWYKENYPKMYAWINGSTVIYSESVSPRIGDTMYTTPYIGTAYSTVTAVNSETIGVASTRTVNGLVFTRYTDGDVEPTIVYTAPFAITANYKGRTYTDAFVASSGVAEFTHEYIVDNKDVKYYRYPFEDRKLDKSRLFSVFILANEHGNHGDSMIPSVTVMRMLKDLCGNTDNLFLKWLKENAIVTVIPLGNPYGGYNNANGVNINRNYDTPGWAGSDTDPTGGTKEEGAFGAYAGSEIETQYIMNTIQQCKAQTAVSYHGRGIPDGVILGEYNSAARFQGCGFDAERMWKVEEALFSMYNFGFNPAWHTIEDDSHNNYLSAGKSPSYIEYTGAVGGLIEIDDFEVGTLDRFTPLAMEQAYAEVLLVLQNWCEEALLKASS